MEQVDEAPGDFLGIVFERRVGKESEQVGPDSGERLLDGVAVGQVGRGWAVGAIGREVAELELGKLCGKAGMHGLVSLVRAPEQPAPGARSTRPSRLSRTEAHRGKPPAEAGAGRPAERGNTGREPAGCGKAAPGQGLSARRHRRAAARVTAGRRQPRTETDEQSGLYD